MSMNTTLSVSGRVNDIQSHPKGEPRGQTKLVSITEDVRKFAAEQEISQEEALQVGLKEKPAEFVKKGSEVYPRHSNTCSCVSFPSSLRFGQQNGDDRS